MLRMSTTQKAQANLTFTRQPLSSADLAKLQQLAQDDKFYTLRLPGFTSSVRASCFATLPGASQPQQQSSVMGPSLLVAGAQGYGGQEVVPPGGYSKPGAGGGRLPAGGSPIDRPLGVMPGEHGAMSGSGTEAAKPEKSWLEKNWMFLAGGVMLVMNVVGSAAKHSGAAPAGSGAAAAPARR
ncbi:Er membrane protein complex subunit 10-like [Haematococcus lacustris]|uniref:Er membrane protein complex subunit 10-like n=1 Tax=Haematococcus lacustris TaxID=44745 RepID=A0A699Y8U8_HAELA|nr:Er membrane protein complex subunit 10-like [Haematococcus lacustris]